jgi:hypothetical protein
MGFDVEAQEVKEGEELTPQRTNWGKVEQGIFRAYVQARNPKPST